jgi:hypothetical protein
VLRSTAKVGLVRALGADHIIDYTREDFADGQHRYDVILDTGGNRGLSHLRRALTPKGKLVIVGGATEGRWLRGTDRQLRVQLLSLFVIQKLGIFVSAENAADTRVKVPRGADANAVMATTARELPATEPTHSVQNLAETRTVAASAQGETSDSKRLNALPAAAGAQRAELVRRGDGGKRRTFRLGPVSTEQTLAGLALPEAPVVIRSPSHAAQVGAGDREFN